MNNANERKTTSHYMLWAGAVLISIIATAILVKGCGSNGPPSTPQLTLPFEEGDCIPWDSFSINDFRPADSNPAVDAWLKNVDSIDDAESANEASIAKARKTDESASSVSGGHFPSCVEIISVSRSTDAKAVVKLAYVKNLQIAGPLTVDGGVFPFSIRSSTDSAPIEVELGLMVADDVTTVQSIDAIREVIADDRAKSIVVQGVVINGNRTTLADRLNPLDDIVSTKVRDSFGNMITVAFRGPIDTVTLTKMPDNSWRITEVDAAPRNSTASGESK